MDSRFAGRRWLAWLAVVLACAVVGATANVEKTIFVAAPAAGVASGTHSTHGRESAALWSAKLLSSRLPRLTPDSRHNAWRTALPAAFSWADNFPANGTTWVLLDELRTGQRYELRVCWAATVSFARGGRWYSPFLSCCPLTVQQPTAFSLDVLDIATVAATTDMAASLTAALEAEGDTDADDSSSTPVPPGHPPPHLLRIIAAADYVAADRAAMRRDRVPPVFSDIILDPYLLIVLPRSLLPVVAAIVAVAAASAWLVRCLVLPQLLVVAAEGDDTGTTPLSRAESKKNK